MIKDSGERREFETGAVRDIQKGKGRCDLMPLDVASMLLHSKEEESNPILDDLSLYVISGNTIYLLSALNCFAKIAFESTENMLLEVSVHFEEGALKYGENNWQKGIPTQCYIDSAVRHYMKYSRGDNDERHDRAFVWNLMCCIWTCIHKPELNTYKKKE